MSSQRLNVLVVGATGSIGRLVVAEAIRQGHAVRALVRDLSRAQDLTLQAQRVLGDVTHPETLPAAVEGVDAIVFAHGSDGGSKKQAEQVDYGAVRNVLEALAGRRVRVALMTAIGATDRQGAFNRATEVHDWKRRGERLVRGSGLAYTIVRPGWFDMNEPDQQQLAGRQGDSYHAGDPSDGVVSRKQIAEVLVRSLNSGAALGKTFELVADHGPATTDFETLFAALKADVPGALDAILDTPNMPLADEPERVRNDIEHFSSR